MIQLKFKIDKFHLAYKLWSANFFTKNNKNQKEWNQLYKEIEHQYGSYPGYSFFVPENTHQALCWTNFGTGKNVQIIRDEKTLKKIFDTIFKSSCFKKKYSECRTFKKQIEEAWRKNYRGLKIFEKITGLQSSKTFEVFLLHPELESGCYLGMNQIEWGCTEDYDGHHFIGLCHEILHGLTQKQYQLNKTEAQQWLLHAVICLSADEELRIQMYKGNYLDPGSPYLSTPLLKKAVKKILPEWKKYTGSSKKRTILDFFQQIKDRPL